jgi:hypothetical protein
VKEPAEVSPRTVTDNRLGRPKTFRETAETEHTRSYQGGLWLSFLNTVRTERFDQVLAIKALLLAIARAAFRPCVGCVRNREAAAGEESAMTQGELSLNLGDGRVRRQRLELSA